MGRINGLLMILAVFVISVAYAREPVWKNDYIVPPGIVRSGVNGEVLNRNVNSAWGIGNTLDPWERSDEVKRTIGRALIRAADKQPELFWYRPHVDISHGPVLTVDRLSCTTPAEARGVLFYTVYSVDQYRLNVGRELLENLGEIVKFFWRDNR